MPDPAPLSPDHPPSPPIFVIGTPRSGTTLVAKILGNHPRVFMPGETHFFSDIYAQRKQLGELPDVAAAERVLSRLSTLYKRYNEPDDQERINGILADPERSRQLGAALTDYQSAFSTFMRLQLEHAAKARWGNNTPKDLFHVEDIRSFYPDAQFILCIRDPRDFAKSYRGKWKVTSEPDRIRRLYHPVITPILWKASMRRALALREQLPADRLLEVHYETLVSEPEATVRGICAFLGEEYRPEMLSVTFSNSSETRGADGIYAASVGSWRGQLSAEEVWAIQRLAREEMRVLGYTPEPVRPNPLRLAGLVLSAPWALWRALKANRANTGPIGPYLMRRVRNLASR